jgi:hypothetical protein
MGIFTHARFGRALSARRERLFSLGLTHRQEVYRATPTFITAALLLAIGLVTLATVALRMLRGSPA